MEKVKNSNGIYNINNLQEHLLNCQSELESYRKKIDEQDEIIYRYCEKEARQRQIIEQHKKRIEHLEQADNTDRCTVNSYAAKVKEQERSLNEYRQRITEYQHSLHHHSIQEQRLQLRSQELEAMLRDAKQEIELLNKNKDLSRQAELDNSIKQHQVIMERLKSESESQSSQYKQVISELNQQVKELHEMLKHKEEMLQAALQENRELLAQIEKVQEEMMQSHQAQQMEWQAKLDEKEKEIAGHIKEMSRFKPSFWSFGRKNRVEFDRNLDQMEQQREALQELRRGFLQLEREQENLVQNFVQKEMALQEIVKNQEAMLEVCNMRNDEQVDLINTYTDQNEQDMKALEAERQTLDEYKKRLQEAEHMITNFKAQQLALSTTIRNQETKLGELDEKEHELQYQLQEKESEIEHLNKAIEKLKSKAEKPEVEARPSEEFVAKRNMLRANKRKLAHISEMNSPDHQTEAEADTGFSLLRKHFSLPEEFKHKIQQKI